MGKATPSRIADPFGVEIDLETGAMADPKRCLVRKASDMRGYYADGASLERLIAEQNDPLHYEVFEIPVPEEQGQLMCCISKLQPGTAEIYLCIRGEGCMLMKTSGGKFAAEKMLSGRMVYVPPFWAHRSVNTGDGPLVSFCVYPGHAGHNYGDIHTEGFPKRVFMVDGKAVIR
jgi:glucose-6-phosphate isomerase